MKLTVNGDILDYNGEGSVKGLLDEMGSRPDRTALMVNGEVVPRSAWNDVSLSDGDVVELLVFAGGG